jgi:hypothetical protein
MSSKIKNSSRDSIALRIGDNLLEDILSYLSIEDKIKFESVSKKWKELIFNQQTVLELDGCTHEKRDNSLDQLLSNKVTCFYKVIN